MSLRGAAATWLEPRWYASARPPALLRAAEQVYLGLLGLRAAPAPRSVCGVPVVVIGNIGVGGTGKTALVIAIAEALAADGLTLGIVTGGYGGRLAARGVVRVTPHSAAADCGDEPLLLATRLGIPVWAGRDRRAALQSLLADTAPDLVLADDGLQHTALPRRLEICVVDGARGLGNGHCLPAGPLREPASRLAGVDYVMANGTPCRTLPRLDGVMHLEPLHWRGVTDDAPRALDALAAGSRVHAVAGIGNPARFFATLRGLGLEVVEHAFPDHHRFRARELVFGPGARVVMTEKDAVKCRGFAPPDALALRVSARLPPGFLAWLRRGAAIPPAKDA